ncbi:MAG: hypothetical protein J5870_01435 [Clostridia bacterium]|nr:hypothetical protein [Clostridia bacterium]
MLKKLFAITLCVLFVFAFASCKNDNTDKTTTASQSSSETETSDDTTATQEQTSEDITSETEPVTETTAEITEESTAETTTAEATETTTEKETTAPATTQKETTTKKETTTQKETTTKKEVKVPSTKAEIVELYNTATKTASTAKPGYVKNTNTSLNNLQMGALARIDLVRTTVGEFMGEGKSSKTVKKGNFNGKDLKVSTLRPDDVTSATCKLSADGKYYDIVITVKNENDVSKKSSAIGRFTNDYKDAAEIKAGLTEGGANVDSVSMKTDSVVIKAKISVDGNKFSSLSYTIKMSAVLTNVKYSIARVSKATGELVSQIDYTSFNY